MAAFPFDNSDIGSTPEESDRCLMSPTSTLYNDLNCSCHVEFSLTCPTRSGLLQKRVLFLFTSAPLPTAAYPHHPRRTRRHQNHSRIALKHRGVQNGGVQNARYRINMPTRSITIKLNQSSSCVT